MASRGRGHSCEPGRKAAYSEDIRWRMVWQHQVQGLTLDQVATNLCVDTSTVHRIVSRFQATGVVSKKPYSVANRIVKLTNAVQLTVLNLVLEKPGIYLWEIQQELMWICGAYVSPSSLCNMLKRNNFTRKKMQLIAQQRDEQLRATFAIDVSLYTDDLLVFIDETGCDRRDALRKRGYGL